MPTANQTAYIAKTLLAVQRELWSFSGITPAYDPATTINTKHNVFASLLPRALPTCRYFGIGINGFHNVTNTNLSDPNPILMTDMDLYTKIPFRCVPVEQDLSPQERSDYRMRVRETINGADYWCYYLKRMTYTDTAVRLTTTDPITNLETPYTINYDNLNPTVPATDTNGVITSATTEVNVSVTASMPVTGAEVVEVISVKYGGDLRYARISELGVYSGEDQTVSGLDVNGNVLSYTEAVFAQLALKKTWLADDFSNTTKAETYSVTIGSGSLLLL